MNEEPLSSVEQLLAEAHRRIVRLPPSEAEEQTRNGAALIDIRSESQRARDGCIPGAHEVPRNVLEWRLDPQPWYRAPALADPRRLIVLISDEGYQSSLAAATLTQFGLQVADVIGGAKAWQQAGLPLLRPRGGGRGGAA